MTPLARYLDPAVIQQVERLDLRARFIVEGLLAGLHGSPMQGMSAEFSEHRKYTQGDDPRTIDWNLYARTDRLFVRKHTAETHLACHILIDASASMGRVGEVEGERSGSASGGWKRRKKGGGSATGREAGMGGAAAADETMNKLEYAVHLTAALGYLVTRQQDAIGVGVIGEGLERFLPARSRRADLVQILAELSRVRPAGKTGLAAGIHAALSRIAHRGVVIVMSDLLTEGESCMEALHHVRHRGHDLIVMHILDAIEAGFGLEGMVRLEDPETGETMVTDARGVRDRFVRAVAEWREATSRRLAALRADYVALDTATVFDKALVEFLIRRSRTM